LQGTAGAQFAQSAQFQRQIQAKKPFRLEEEIIYTKKKGSIAIKCLTGWWFGTFCFFSIYWECHHPN
jgi:hypothetical protein